MNDKLAIRDPSPSTLPPTNYSTLEHLIMTKQQLIDEQNQTNIIIGKSGGFLCRGDPRVRVNPFHRNPVQSTQFEESIIL